MGLVVISLKNTLVQEADHGRLGWTENEIFGIWSKFRKTRKTIINYVNMTVQFVNKTSYGNYSLSNRYKFVALPLAAGQDDNQPKKEVMDKAIAMMDAPIDKEPHVTTVFASEGEEESKVYSDTPYKTAYSENEDSIKDFLGKPYLIGQATWTTGLISNALMINIAPGVLLQAGGIAMWSNKILGYNLVRGTFCAKLMINATPFMQGKLIMNFLPTIQSRTASTFGVYTCDLAVVTQTPNVELDCSETACMIKIPYVSPSLYYDVKNATFDWGLLQVRVLSPLAVGGSAADVTADVTLWGWWEDFELAAPTIPQSGFVTKKFGKEEAEAGKPISKALLLTSKAASALSVIPSLTSIAKPVEWTTRFLANLASAYGYSKPIVTTSPEIASLQFNRYMATSDGVDLAKPLALIHDNELKRNPTCSIRSDDEMSFSFLKGVYSLIGSYTWNSSGGSAPIGSAIIASFGIAPYHLYKNGSTVTGAHTMNWNVGPPIFYLSQLFQYWRGGVKIKIKFVKTQFHTGRVLITWTPNYQSAGIAVPDVYTSGYSLREVVDIRYSNEVELTLPYLLSTNFADTNQPSGYFQVIVLNELRAPETCPLNIQCLLYVAGADDFEFAGPFGNSINQVPCFAQSDVVVKDVIGNRRVLDETIHDSLSCMGEKFTSVKQLLNRNSWIRHANAYTTGNNQLSVYPWFVSVPQITSGGILVPSVGGDIYNFIAPMYGFFRGGVNISPFFPTNGVSSVILINEIIGSPTIAITSGTFSTTGTNVWYNGLSAGTGATGALLNDVSPGFSTYSVPYYSTCRMSQVLLDNTGTAYNIGLDQPVHRLNITHAVNATGVEFFRSVRDDFQFSYFLGCPPVITSYT